MAKYVQFSKEQLEIANNVDLVDFLKKQGEALEKSGKEMRWLKNTSVTVKGNRWYQHKYQEGGYPIQFLRKFYHYSFPDAVQLLLNESGTAYEQYHPVPDVKKEFRVPKRNETMKRVYGYLLKHRHIDGTILNDFVNKGLIYESEKYHNVVFAGFDEEGIMRHAHKRSTFGTYRGNEEGSDPAYSFHFTGTSNQIYVFEAPIDLLSYISLKAQNDIHWQQHHYVALCGVSIQPLLHQLQVHSQLTDIILCLDHDVAGNEAMSRIKDELQNQDRAFHIYHEQANNKDWNEDLKLHNGVEDIQSGIDNPNQKMFHQLLNDYEHRIDIPKDKVEIKGIMDQYVSLFPLFNTKEQLDLEALRNHLCSLSAKAIKYMQQITNAGENAFECMIKGYRSHLDRGNQAKRIELLEEDVHSLKNCYVNKELPNRQNRMLKRLLDVADDSMMLLAYLDMQEDLKQYIKEENKMEQNRKPKCPLVGSDGNVFNLIGLTQKSLRIVGREEEAKEMFDRVTHSGSYQEALAIMQEYINPTSIDEFGTAVFRELENLRSDLRDMDTEKLNEICLDVMESEDTEEALMKMEDYRHEHLPSVGMKME